jgi:hypothetical protein
MEMPPLLTPPPSPREPSSPPPSQVGNMQGMPGSPVVRLKRNMVRAVTPPDVKKTRNDDIQKQRK